MLTFAAVLRWKAHKNTTDARQRLLPNVYDIIVTNTPNGWWQDNVVNKSEN